MTHLLLFTAFVLWYSCFEAKDDAQEIAEHREIDHTHQWIERAVAFFCAWFITWIICSLPSTWPLLLGHAFLFSAVFRWRLNKLRGKHWAYVAPWSNVYDRVWYFLAGGTWVPRDLYAVEVRWYERDIASTRRYTHRAGRLAYGFEITLFALGTAGAVVMQLKG